MIRAMMVRKEIPIAVDRANWILMDLFDPRGSERQLAIS
jgi:hypothetical protein